jgi:hypothetical protein
MSNLLSTAKQILIETAQTIYDDRRTDLERDLKDYQDHYKNLGAIIFQIDSYKSLGDILNDMENDNLSELGYWGADEGLVEDFISAVDRAK